MTESISSVVLTLAIETFFSIFNHANDFEIQTKPLITKGESERSSSR